MESLIWLSAGVGLGLFVAMSGLAFFAWIERRRLRRLARLPAVVPPAAEPLLAAVPAPTPTPEPPQSPAVTPAAAATEPRPQDPAPESERAPLDIEGLFEEAFQSSLKPERQPDDRPEQKRP